MSKVAPGRPEVSQLSPPGPQSSPVLVFTKGNPGERVGRSEKPVELRPLRSGFWHP